MAVKEKHHRLPREFYKGQISCVFTFCLKRESVAAGFSLREPRIVNAFTEIFTSVVTNANCIVPVYCFMPDHQHLIITGLRNDSDLWKVMAGYKQKTGFWMSINRPGLKWQKDFYDHVIRTGEDIAAQVRYILDNPVRKVLVSSWKEYPFKGSIGCAIEDILHGIM